MARKLYLSRTEKKIAGVCGGIASYLECDVTVVRIIALVLWLCCGFGPLAYLIIWAVAPKEPEQL